MIVTKEVYPMMIKIVLFNKDSMIRIAKRTKRYFKGTQNMRGLKNILWLEGGYIKFTPRLITINQIKPDVYDLQDYLKEVMKNEEIYISDDKTNGKYIEEVKNDTSFDIVGGCNNE